MKRLLAQGNGIVADPADARELTAAGPCVAIVAGGRVLLVGGLVNLAALGRPGVAMLWVLIDQHHAQPHAVALHRVAMRLLNENLFGQIEFPLIGTADERRHRWLRSLGFQRGAIARGYFADGSPAFIYARTKSIARKARTLEAI